MILFTCYYLSNDIGMNYVMHVIPFMFDNDCYVDGTMFMLREITWYIMYDKHEWNIMHMDVRLLRNLCLDKYESICVSSY